jgi:hypothetical protein
MPFFTLIAAILFVGAAFNANAALPGDVLYPIKLNVNEKVRTLVSIGDSANARAHVQAAESRLGEAGKLEVQNKLTAPVRTILEARLSEEIGMVRQYIAKLQTEGNPQSAAAIETELKAKLSEKGATLKMLNPQFNPDNLDSFVTWRTVTVPASTTLIQISEPTIETSTTSGEGIDP